jgi:hypothetical protein
MHWLDQSVMLLEQLLFGVLDCWLLSQLEKIILTINGNLPMLELF